MATKSIRTRGRSSRSLAPRTIKPVVIRTTKVVKQAKRHVTRKGKSQDLFSTDRVETVGAGFAVGVIEKLDFVKNLPSLPFLGKTGTVGVAAHLLSNGGRNKMLDNISTAALTIAGYMLGNSGSIVGGDDVDVGEYVAGV